MIVFFISRASVLTFCFASLGDLGLVSGGWEGVCILVHRVSMVAKAFDFVKMVSFIS